MSDFVYIDLKGEKVTVAEVVECRSKVTGVLSGSVPHNLLSHFAIHVTETSAGSRLHPSFGATSVEALLSSRAKRPHALAAIHAVLQWSASRGWHPTLVLEGHRGTQSLPPESAVATSVEAALGSRPKGPYLIRVFVRDDAA